ncbi:hypothetical protein BRD17_08385 [Halobacteriales archaeon SW_7_68_16]|nr:MAG: hypothetical protein BRD17_08385 [Halobacteriales archaeon SW_7_68_16]
MRGTAPAIAAAVITVALVAGAAGIAGGQSGASANVTEREEPERIVRQVDESLIVESAEYHGGEMTIVFRVERPLAEITATGFAGGGEYGFRELTLDRGRHEVSIATTPVDGEALVGIVSDKTAARNRGVSVSRDVGLGLPDVIQSAPTVSLVQIGVVAGALGAIGSFSVALARLRSTRRRRYRDQIRDEYLTRDEVVVDDDDPVVMRLASRVRASINLHRTVVLGAIALYVAAMLAGEIQDPGGIWDSLSDTQRLIAAGSLISLSVSYLPMLNLLKRVLPRDEIDILDVDVSDTIDAEYGGRHASWAVYGAHPELVEDLELPPEEGAVDQPSTDGQGLVIRNLDPVQNTARGTWISNASDLKLIRDRAEIRQNRENLAAFASVGRDLIGDLPGIQLQAEGEAAVDIADAEGEILTFGDGVTELLRSAAAGTPLADDVEDLIDDGLTPRRSGDESDVRAEASTATGRATNSGSGADADTNASAGGDD